MATIQPFVAKGTHVGQKVPVKVKKIFWMPVGKGSVKIFNDYEVQVAGTINVLGYNGPLNIHLKLLDQDPASKKGPCCLQLNSHTDENARYTSTGKMLTVYAVLGDAKQNIHIRRVERDKQTECELFGHINETVHLDPT
jgi:hypothetical protein